MIRRDGFTLLESVGVISAVGTILTLSASILNQSFSAHRIALDHLQRVHALEQFVERWRFDVHSAKQVTFDDARLIITQASGISIEYTFKDELVIRTRLEEGTEIGHDSWRLPNTCTATWKLDDEGKLLLVEGKLVFSDQPVVFEAISLVARVGTGASP